MGLLPDEAADGAAAADIDDILEDLGADLGACDMDEVDDLVAQLNDHPLAPTPGAGAVRMGNRTLCIVDEQSVAKNEPRLFSAEYEAWVQARQHEPAPVAGPDGRCVMLLSNDTARSSSYISFRLRGLADGQEAPSPLPAARVTSLQLVTSAMQPSGGRSGDFSYVGQNAAHDAKDMTRTLGKKGQERENLHQFSRRKGDKKTLDEYRQLVQEQLCTTGEVEVCVRVGDVSKTYGNRLVHVRVTVEYQGQTRSLTTAPIHVLSSLPEQIFFKNLNGPKKRRQLKQETGAAATGGSGYDAGCVHLSKRPRVVMAALGQS